MDWLDKLDIFVQSIDKQETSKISEPENPDGVSKC